ncbi:MAG: rhamnulokinase family protein [Bacillota bacterium]|nr:rhamnulokinase family protein [Bacillota bacterium]
MASLKTLAYDFGASSGRAILAEYDGSKVTLTETHRFSNDFVGIGDDLYWDILRLFFEIKSGISATANSGYKDIASIGIDTWGVDYGLLDKKGKLLANPHHYRDKRTFPVFENIEKYVSKDFIYKETGIQFANFNTLFQLLEDKISESPALLNAETMLMIPDLFNYFLTGEKVTEYSIASTSQLYNSVNDDWSWPLIKKLGLPEKIFTKVIHPGVLMGNLLPSISEELGIGRVPVAAVASHDTASAVAAVPAEKDESYVYISCGTWSLLGVEIDKPLINELTSKYNFTNEGGINKTIRLLKNVMGLWIIQESRRQWKREGKLLSFDDMEKAAWDAAPFKSFIDPDNTLFSAPGNMPKYIAEFCSKTGQAVPESVGETTRCIAQSLAMKYRYTIECLEDILGKKIDVVHLVGGGIKDKMMCQFTANACGRKVVAGPVEATSMGNIASQLIALGEIKTLDEARQIVKASFEPAYYEPKDTEAWDAAYENFKKLL